MDTFEQSAQDLGKAIDATRALSKRDKVVVFGHSFGPNIVNEYLSKPGENEKVSSAIYLSPVPIDLVGYLKMIRILMLMKQRLGLATMNQRRI